MVKQYKIMIFVNILLGLLFIASNFIYDYFGNMPSHRALWSPLWLTFYNYQFAASIGGEIGVPEPNFSFYFFWVLMIANIYFIVRFQKSRETKPNTT
jgi:hypothetical protein